MKGDILKTGQSYGCADYRNLIKFDENGKGDITPLLQSGIIFGRIIEGLSQPFFLDNFDKIAGIEARGFVFAAAMAHRLGKGLVLVRKCGKIPFNTMQLKCFDYSGSEKCLEISREAIHEGDKILVVDDWLETGSQLKSTIAIIKELGGVVSGIAMLINAATPEAQKYIADFKYHFLINLPPTSTKKTTAGVV